MSVLPIQGITTAVSASAPAFHIALAVCDVYMGEAWIQRRATLSQKHGSESQISIAAGITERASDVALRSE
jgi:hypothetical protein